MTAEAHPVGGGFEALFTAPLSADGGLQTAHNEAFNRYVTIHKVFVGRHGEVSPIKLMP